MRVVISGYYGLDNIGDEAVLEAIVKGLRKHNPKIKITVLSATPATTEGALNLKAISRFAFLEIIRELKKADTFISGGGTLLQNSTSTKSFWYYLGLVWLAKFLKKKVMIFAQGFGPLTGQFNLALAKKVLNRVDVITLRDPESFDKVKKLGIDQPRVELTADPTFIFEPIAPPNYKPLVGISIRDFKGKTDQFYQDFAAFIDWLAQEFNFEPVFLLFQPQHDQAIIENITLHLKTKYEVLGTDYNAGQMLSAISQLGLLIGMRLHSLIFACLSSVPMLGLSYDPKVESFMKMIEQPCIDLEAPLDFAALKSSIKQVIANSPKIKATLATKSKELREKAAFNFELLGSLTPPRFD